MDRLNSKLGQLLPVAKPLRQPCWVTASGSVPGSPGPCLSGCSTCCIPVPMVNTPAYPWLQYVEARAFAVFLKEGRLIRTDELTLAEPEE